jgi:multiple RNA-binding domain-containing protein 1
MAIHGSDERAVESTQLIASRLCIKNIPKYLNETRLKEHFGSKGEVTDVKILRTK